MRTALRNTAFLQQKQVARGRASIEKRGGRGGSIITSRRVRPHAAPVVGEKHL